MTSAALRAASKPLPAILKNFQRKEFNKLRTALSSQPSSSSQRPEIRNPFLPIKTVAGKWRPPQYSLRRQKELAKAAKAIGLDLTKTLPIGPKTLTMVGSQRLNEAIARTASAIAKATEESAEKDTPDVESSRKAVQGDSSPSTTPAITRLPPIIGRKGIVITWSSVLPRKLASRASAVASSRPGERVLRLYGGRKKMFKGHKWERNMLKRKGQIRVRMRDMEQRIKRFRHVYERKRPRPLSPAKAKKKDSLPF